MAMKIETPFAALIIISLMFVGLFTVYVGMSDSYDVSNDFSVYSTQAGEISFEEAFDEINKTKNDMDSFTEEFENTLLNSDDNLFSFFNLALKLGKQVYGSVTSIKDITTIFIELSGFPADSMLLFSIFIVGFVVLIVFILLGRSIVN